MEKATRMTIKIHLVFVLRGAIRLFVCCALLAKVVPAQTNQSPTVAAPTTPVRDKVAEAMDRLAKGDISPADTELMAKTKNAQAIPELKKQFDLTQDPESKEFIASALVRLGDKDSTWWNYLMQQAAEAVVSDMPSPLALDAKGKMLPGLSPEILVWGAKHNLTDEEIKTNLYYFQAAVSALAETGDRRAIPLLRQALSSPNYMIQGSAANGLAQLGDKASIPLIIEACRQASKGAAGPMAIALLQFDDPQAQSAAKAFMPSKDSQ